MIDKNPNVADQKSQAVCLVIGQLLFAAATFLWKPDGRYSVDAATLLFFSMLGWSIGFIGLFKCLQPQAPFYSRAGLLYALYGVLGGVAFAFEGLYADIYGLSEKIGVDAFQQYPLQMNLVLFWSGPAFPLSIMVLGIVLARYKKVNWPVGILFSIGGLSFPIGRILRLEWVAHLTDLLLLLPVLIIAYKFWNEPEAEMGSME